MIDLRLGDWQTALADVGVVDAVICDPPYGARTHAGNVGMGDRFNTEGYMKGDGATRDAPGARSDLTYAAWSQQDVADFVAYWSPRCAGWMACMTSDDLIPVWRQAYAAAGRLDFAPVPILQDRVRLGGDGPASGAVYLMVARPRRKEFLSWGALPGYYGASIDRGGHIGGKPLGLMHRLINDYSRPGNLVCDPCAGGATTLIAAHQSGRHGVGAEIDPTTHAKASERVRKVLAQPLLFGEGPAKSLSIPGL